MKFPLRLVVFLVALVIGVVALPAEYHQIETLARAIGGPLLSLVTHLGAAVGLLACIVISFLWMLPPVTKEKPSKGQKCAPKSQPKSQDSPPVGSAEEERQTRLTAELNRRKQT